MVRAFQFLVLAALSLLMFVGCDANGKVEVGPIALTMPATAGTIDPAEMIPADLPIELDAGIPLPVMFEVPYCELPTEADVTAVYEQVAGSQLGDIAELSRLDLVQVTLNALEGSFGQALWVEVHFQPAPVLGIPQFPVVLGRSVGLTGSETEIILTPPNEVDLLELIRQADENIDDECPSIRVIVLPLQMPSEPITYTVDLEIDAYAALNVSPIALWALQ
jgi:hypothetical protein